MTDDINVLICVCLMRRIERHRNELRSFLEKWRHERDQHDKGAADS